jgi:hypothetical protein
MFSKYIIRFDDACPTMDKDKWQKVEDLCDKYDVKPIVAVIPNNQDPKLVKDESDQNFWGKVRRWQEKGWNIALHGYDHVYISKDSGLVPFNKKSEFAGLTYENQAQKIKAGMAIFKKENINTNIWVAPSHTFDKNTLKAIKDYTDIKIISDGVSLFPFQKYGFNWIPQQLWHFRKMPFGIWTCCIHPNEMDELEYTSLESFIKNNYDKFISIDELEYKSSKIYKLLNLVFNSIYWKLKKRY